MWLTSADIATRMPCTSGRPPTNRPGFANGQGILAASTLSGRSSSWVTRPLGQVRRGDRMHRQPRLAFLGARQRRLEDLGEHQGVVERVVGLHLRDAPVRGERLQPQVLGPEVEATGQLDGAHHAVDRQLGLDEFGLGGQERVVEADVVGDQRAPAQQVDQVADDVAEGRLALQHLGGEAVHVRRTGVDAGVEQAGEALLDVAVVTEGQRRDADDARLPRLKTRGLDVDDRPAGTGLVG